MDENDDMRRIIPILICEICVNPCPIFEGDQLLTELPSFLKGFPDLNESETLAQLNKKSSVFRTGIDG